MASWGRNTPMETVQTATTEPAQVAQTTVEKKGAQNQSISDFARKIAGAQVAPAAFTPKTEATAEGKPEEAPKTEAQAAPQTEATETEPKTEVAEATETAEETETEAEEVPSHENSSLDPKLQAKIDRRIGKEVAKRKALEQEVAELKELVGQKPTEVEKEVPVPIPPNVPLPEIQTQDQLEAYKVALASDIIEAEGLLYDFPAEGMDTKWGHVTKPQLRAMLTEAKKTQQLVIPAKEKFIATKAQVSQTAQEKFPFLKDPTHEGYALAQAAKKDPANAWIRGLPNSDYVIGLMVRGQLAMQAEEAKPAKQGVKPRPTPTKGQSEIASDASIQRAPVETAHLQGVQVERAKILGNKSLGAKEFSKLLQLR